ncbi:MAG TPA: 2-oxoacid ferredoxin oxidoreductase [Anaerolineae bacterium]|nr:2-oxoacid ferredoxin oxidoreductase [Anaerolineae bacterium]HIP95678.1 2-oxoacid ferredoxin oxidoreductase [Anaerolineae bacterium]
MLTRKDFKGGGEPTWCKGCGNYGILNAVKMALAEQGIAPHQVVIFTGIGCGSKLPHYMKVSGFHTIHGRALAVATGARLANHSLKIMAIHGDGDGYGMGLGHWLHAVRRNIGLVDLVQNNRVYGLTRGQYSPTSDPGMVTPTSPEGAIDRPVPPLALAIAAGATFVARGYPGQLRHLAWLIGEALQHSGYALVDVLQPCVTFNRPSSYDFYKPRVYKLEETDHDVTDKTAAWELAYEWGDRIPIGIFYRVEGVPTYEEQVPALKAGPLVKQPLEKLRPEQIEDLQAEFI